MGQWKENMDTIWDKVQCPGLSACAEDVFRLGHSIPRRLGAFRYKKNRQLLWITLIGGTGTGKSTIFNSLCGDMLSQAGIERPKTSGPIVFAHGSADLERDLPLEDVVVERISKEDLLSRSGTGALGGEGRMVFVEHTRESLAHLAIVDTPDLDSLEIRNRRIVEELMLLSDVVLFVTSQEKYADEVPFRFFKRFYREGKKYFFVLNKAQHDFNTGEVLDALHHEGIPWKKDQTFVLPYLARDPGRSLMETSEFASFYKQLMQMFTQRNLQKVIREARKRDSADIAGEMRQLLQCLQEEKKAAKKWTQSLDILFERACLRLAQYQRNSVSDESRQYIHRQIRKHFDRYDVLRKPRLFFVDLVRMPLNFLGLVGKRHEESHEEALERIRRQINITPLEVAMESFNREVLEKLSPQDPAAPLFKNIRRQELVLTQDEIRDLVHKEQDHLVVWLEDTFRRMAEGIPKSKQLGIHSMSILWGALIISLETLVMGGITVLEAVFSSALAPFITKGAVEVFAHRELKVVARELRQRYQDGLVSVMRHQRMRYEECVRSLLVDDQTLMQMETALAHLDA